jgi:hypothetical protein
MATGRKTGGRRKGTPNKRTTEFHAAVVAAGVTPLEYMLKVLRDRNAEWSRRDEMAKAAAPYLHPRLAAIEHGNKNELGIADRLAAALKRAGMDDDEE